MWTLAGQTTIPSAERSQACALAEDLLRIRAMWLEASRSCTIVTACALVGCGTPGSRLDVDASATEPVTDGSIAAADVSPYLADFTNASWSALTMGTDQCSGLGLDGSIETTTDTIKLMFVQNGAGLSYESIDGCFFKFSVSGDTATLSNGPVTCHVSTDAGNDVLTYQDYTAMTSDGLHMTIALTGTSTVDGVTCTFTANGTATATR
jgi:hypothetical protein